MTIQFNNVTFERDGKTVEDLVQTSHLREITPGTFLCSSHCQIETNAQKYVVLWNLEKVQNNAATSIEEQIDESQSQEVQETRHCLPFKVLGTCHSTSRQDALEEAFSYLHEHNRPIFARIEAEPENAHDKHAIAVYISSSSGYEKVGFIARELTKYIHPILNDRHTDVDVHKIRFCTTFQKIGFYLSINITKKGLWDDEVVKASKKVR